MKITLTMMALLAFFPNSILAQCSDAGVCSIGSAHAQSGHSVGVSYTFGKSGKADDLTFHTIQIEGNIRVFDDSRITILLPLSGISGPLGRTSGIGDLVVLLDQPVWDLSGDLLSIQIGGKLATGKSDAGNLPQAYQSGLGTNDFLFGVSYTTGSWLIGAGYQLAGGRSNNPVTRLERGDDLLGRIGYTMNVDEFTVGLELLAIQRLGESSVLNPAVPGNNSFIDVPGSDQFQANLLATGSVPLSGSTNLRALAAVPLRSRNINLDGLTRSITLSAGIQFSL